MNACTQCREKDAHRRRWGRLFCTQQCAARYGIAAALALARKSAPEAQRGE